MFTRATHGKIINLIQSHGAKIHFNSVDNQDLSEIVKANNFQTDLSPEQLKNTSLRYGVIGMQDLVRDLHYWETLLVSSMMQRPIKRIIDRDGVIDKGQVWNNYQQKNLKSALAFAALTTPSGSSDKILY